MSAGLGGLSGTLQAQSVLSMMEQLQQRQQEDLAQRSAELEQQASQAQGQYQQAAAAPEPQLDPADVFVPTLLGHIASIIGQDPGFIQRAQEGIKAKKSDLLKARADNLLALRDVYSQKADEAQQAGDLDSTEKYRRQYETLTKTLDTVNQSRSTAESLENLRHQNRLAEIAARGSAKAEPLVIVEGPTGPEYVPRSEAVGRKATTPSATRGKIPTAGEREALVGDLAIIKQLGDTRTYFKPEFTGPVTGGLTGSLTQAIGIGRRPGEGRFRAALAGIRNQILKLRSGAAITTAEAQRLLEELPTPDNPPDTFNDKLDQFEETFREIAQNRRDVMAETGVDVEKLRPLPPTLKGATPVETPTYVRMKKPNGQIRDVRSDKVSEAVSNGWKRAPK